MMIEILHGSLLREMLLHGAASLSVDKEKINDMNVFPVPDGDTGTNMSMTVGAAAAELQKKMPNTVSEVAAVTASAMLRGARGNSGVITSLLFRGFSKQVKDMETIDGAQFAAGLTAGVQAAYKAVMKPAEGTMLTVSRLAAVGAEEAAQENLAVEFVLEKAIEAAEIALAGTIDQNPVLKKAGVVDAGGVGYVAILKGMLNEMRGITRPVTGESTAAPQKATVRMEISDEDITFAYCTEFICSRDNNKDPEKLRSYLDGMGDSLVLVEDDDIIKAHVHTNNPGEVLEKALTYGQLLTVKIENMREQHTEILEAAAEEVLEEEHVMAEPEKKYGFVAVCAGEGLGNVFRELGADGIIMGGQTMNPSTEDILREVNKTPAEVVYVLPNNKNIIMAAQQCIAMVEGKEVVVLPSKTVPQGIAAMLNMEYDDETAENNTQTMTAAMEGVHTMELTYAARNSEFDGTPIVAGDYLALKDNQLFGTDASEGAMLDRMAAEAASLDAEFITIFYGEGVTVEQAEVTAQRFTEACPDAEITLLEGAQPVYSYLISVE